MSSTVLLLVLICSAVLAVHGARQHKPFQNFRTASIIRGLRADATEGEIMGGALHDCYRDCVAGDSRTCVYSFTVSQFTAMSRLCGDCPYTLADCFNTGCTTAGGDVRQITQINHMLPGPSVQVCEGDVIRVNLINALMVSSTTIHWHGMHQFDTPYMDGVPFVTQCPIHPHTTFTYNFTASPSGTHLYHSHSGYQETDGVYGSLIVRSANDPLAEYYDYDLAEHVMIIWHWFQASSASLLDTGLHRSQRVPGYSITINGQAATLDYVQDDIVYNTPRAEFTVTQGSRYRFRSIANTAVYCPIQVSLDNHTLLVVALDGASVSPLEVDSFVINAGERYDFILTADQDIGNYWFRYRGFGNCGSVSGEAILRYEGGNDTTEPLGAIEYVDARRSGVLLNPVGLTGTDYSDNTVIRITELNSTVTNVPDISGSPDHIIYIPFSFNTYSDFQIPGPYPQFNNISFEFPPSSLLTQPEATPEDSFCTDEDDSAKDCTSGYCTCTYIYPVTLNSLVEVVVVDLSVARFVDDHPLHLHGQYVHVVALENGNTSITLEDIKYRNEAGLIDKKLHAAPLKDIIGIPDHGFAIFRFVASNPGYWFFHCHVGAHMEEGMAAIFKVGEHHQMVQPPDDFPTCGNYDITNNYSPFPEHSSPPHHKIK